MIIRRENNKEVSVSIVGTPADETRVDGGGGETISLG